MVNNFHFSTKATKLVGWLVDIVQIGSGVQSNEYRGSFPGGIAAGCEADHSPPNSVEVKKMRIYTSALPYVFMA
jgi:hypothetical protein